MDSALFRAATGSDGEVLLPQNRALSHWDGGGRLRGMAVSGALARAAERAVEQADGSADLRPVRWTVDLLRPASPAACTVSAELVRRGRRLCLVDAALQQEGRLIARGTALFLAAGQPGQGTAWSPARDLPLPPPELRTSTAEPRLYYSEGVGWTGSPAQHQNAERKMTWHFPAQVVAGEHPTPFQQVAVVADVASVVSNWGDAGLEFINADITLALTRLPGDDQELGLAADQRLEDDGLSVGSALVFDRLGALGMATVSALCNGSSLDPRRFGTDTVDELRQR